MARQSASDTALPAPPESERCIKEAWDDDRSRSPRRGLSAVTPPVPLMLGDYHKQ